MTKGEAYKRYYEANKAKILERNKASSRAYRETLAAAAIADPGVLEAYRARGREGYAKGKAKRHEAMAKAAIDELPEEKRTAVRGALSAPAYELSAKAFQKLLGGLVEAAKKPTA